MLVYFAVMNNVSENYTLFFVGSFLSAQVNQRPKFSENQFIVTFKEEEPIGKSWSRRVSIKWDVDSCKHQVVIKRAFTFLGDETVNLYSHYFFSLPYMHKRFPTFLGLNFMFFFAISISNKFLYVCIGALHAFLRAWFNGKFVLNAVLLH